MRVWCRIHQMNQTQWRTWEDKDSKETVAFPYKDLSPEMEVIKDWLEEVLSSLEKAELGWGAIQHYEQWSRLKPFQEESYNQVDPLLKIGIRKELRELYLKQPVAQRQQLLLELVHQWNGEAKGQCN